MIREVWNQTRLGQRRAQPNISSIPGCSMKCVVRYQGDLALLRLEAIHFNHNTNSATGDALNIRLNHLPGTAVQDPEWREGNETLPVAYAREQVGERVTIKARLHGPPNSTFSVRARDAMDFTSNKRGFVKWLALMALRFLRLSCGGVLGEITSSVINFGFDGDSGRVQVEAQAHRIRQVGVGIYHVSWVWEYLE